MTHVEHEINSQPACWRQAARLAVSAGDALPADGDAVAVVGCGTSLYMAQAYAALREAAGQGRTDAFAASEMPARRDYDRVVAITRSGTTTEVLEVLARLTGAVRTTVITADPATPAAAAADDVVSLAFADERSIVQTRFATSALVLLRAHLAPGEDRLGPVIADAERALGDGLPEGALDARQHAFLGRGWVAGIAAEAALKLREAAQAWTEAYPAMEYRHGPISVAGPGTFVWLLDEGAAALAAEVEGTGATPVVGRLDPLAELVRVQRLAVAAARRRGLDPDRPRHLARSVVLGGEQPENLR